MRKPSLENCFAETEKASQVKVMLITLFDHQGLVHYEFVSQSLYEEVLTGLVNKIRQTEGP